MAWRHGWASTVPEPARAQRKAIERSISSVAEPARLVALSAAYSWDKPDAAPSWKEILAFPPAVRKSVAMRFHLGESTERSGPKFYRLDAIAHLAGSPLTWTRDDLLWALRVAGKVSANRDFAPLILPAAIASQLTKHELVGLREPLGRVVAELADHPYMSSEVRRRLSRQFGQALDRLNDLVVPSWILHDRDAFGPAVRHELGPVLNRSGVADLLVSCVELDKPAATAKWLKQFDGLTANGYQAAAAIIECFVSVQGYVHDDHDMLLRGLVWVLSRSDDDAAAKLIVAFASAACAASTRRPKFPYAPKAAAAAVEVLSRTGDSAAMGVLARLSISVKSRPLNSRIVTALTKLAAANGWSLTEAMELAVADHGLDGDGRLVVKVAGYEAVIDVDHEKPKLLFARDGKRLKSTPAIVKSDHADVLKALRALVRDIGKTIAAERLRVESILSEERDWAYEDWVSRYIQHPITGVFGRRMIWQVRTPGGEWVTGLPRHDPSGWVVTDRHDAVHMGERVRLWHPALASTDEVSDWRDRLIARSWRQPIKQAFREVYVLTPAEEATGTYSNRYAGHILRYRQAGALMGARGWHGAHLGLWDGGFDGESTKVFAGGEWRAAFFYDLVENVVRQDYEARFCSTDQVRFSRRDGRDWTVAPVADVPRLVFTEAMRDVDLFVGVTSIAADPSWADRGEARFANYWEATTFGELTASAATRKDVLSRVLPRLKIADRAELTGRFLRVRGNLRTYKIHLGSGNILMEPNDSYLCIVADRSAKAALHLPFDDDAVLSMILSKALLLAADDKITDPSITHQLGK